MTSQKRTEKKYLLRLGNRNSYKQLSPKLRGGLTHRKCLEDIPCYHLSHQLGRLDQL
jgi:hypothetical protein